MSKQAIIDNIEQELSLPKWFEMGGPGSGHWRHAGRKGKVGGSAPSKGRRLLGKKLSSPVGDIGKVGNVGIDGWMSEGLEGHPHYKGLEWSYASAEERAELKAKVARDLAEASGVTEQEAANFVQQWAHSSNDDDMRSLAIQQDAAKEFGVELSDFTQGKIKPLQEKAKQVELKHKLETEYFKAKRAGATEAELVKLESKLDVQWEKTYPGVDMGYVPSGGLGMKSGGGVELSSLMESDKQRALLRSMYNETQAELKARGITEVRLYRGMDIETKTGYEMSDWKRRVGKPIAIEMNSIESWSISKEVATGFAGYGADHVGVVLEAVIPAERILSTPATGFGCLTEGEVIALGGIAGDMANVMEVFAER